MIVLVLSDCVFFELHTLYRNDATTDWLTPFGVHPSFETPATRGASCNPAEVPAAIKTIYPRNPFRGTQTTRLPNLPSHVNLKTSPAWGVVRSRFQAGFNQKSSFVCFFNKKRPFTLRARSSCWWETCFDSYYRPTFLR